MKSKYISFFLLIFIFSTTFAQQKSAKEFQQEINAQYADSIESPLLKKDLATFKGLPFFEIDSQYIVSAHVTRSENIEPFKMKTTTDRRPEYIVYAIAAFELQGKKHTLNLYKSYGSSKPEYDDYLFLPFTDETSGDDTYGGGRFIDLRIPEGDKIIIDFNQAYNPYCVYNYAYSCPIPPAENHLAIRIEAGVKYISKD